MTIEELLSIRVFLLDFHAKWHILLSSSLPRIFIVSFFIDFIFSLYFRVLSYFRCQLLQCVLYIAFATHLVCFVFFVAYFHCSCIVFSFCIYFLTFSVFEVLTILSARVFSASSVKQSYLLFHLLFHSQIECTECLSLRRRQRVVLCINV